MPPSAQSRRARDAIRLARPLQSRAARHIARTPYRRGFRVCPGDRLRRVPCVSSPNLETANLCHTARDDESSEYSSRRFVAMEYSATYSVAIRGFEFLVQVVSARCPLDDFARQSLTRRWIVHDSIGDPDAQT